MGAISIVRHETHKYLGSVMAYSNSAAILLFIYLSLSFPFIIFII